MVFKVQIQNSIGMMKYGCGWEATEGLRQLYDGCIRTEGSVEVEEHWREPDVK